MGNPSTATIAPGFANNVRALTAAAAQDPVRRAQAIAVMRTMRDVVLDRDSRRKPVGITATGHDLRDAAVSGPADAAGVAVVWRQRAGGKEFVAAGADGPELAEQAATQLGRAPGRVPALDVYGETRLPSGDVDERVARWDVEPAGDRRRRQGERGRTAAQQRDNEQAR